MTSLRLTDRALSDINAIDRYCPDRWGRRVADRYLADLGEALDRLQADLSLFKARPDYMGRLRFYAAREHLIVGDVIGGIGYVLSVWHGSMDFIGRLAKLEPELLHEAELMAHRIVAERSE